MRKILLLTALVVCVVISPAQFADEKDKAISEQLVRANKDALRLTSEEVNNLIVHTAYQIPNSDIRMAYMQQSYKGIPVYNQVLVLAFRNGKVVSNAGEILRSMEDRTHNHSGSPVVSPADGLLTALRDRNVIIKDAPQAALKTNDSRMNFGRLGISNYDITGELLWYPADDNGKDIRLVWQYFIAPNNTSDGWLVRVDANTNTVVGFTNLTVYCNWDNNPHSTQEHFEKKHFKTTSENIFVLNKEQQRQWHYRPFVVNNATYRVVKYPAESPIHPNGAPQTHTNPWTWAPGNATTLGWHTSDNVTFYDSTRGNNVFAYEDRNNNNGPGRSPVSTTAQPDLTLNFVPNFANPPTDRTPDPNQQFNTTNLFYWNNLMHDVSYLYGFTESARNFQTNNLGRGGLGNDHVNAEAQDGSGTNNANFLTPADGGNGRMQMYLWTSTTPQRDGDVDNGIVAHEYTHGISTRMTGTGSGCLSTTEQMGEGWSDYYALMVTQDWATSLPADGFNKPRGMGTYALGQPITGVGIRPTQYTTNMAINPSTYANLPTVAVPHGVGYLWCTMLWDMTWEIIQDAGISPNIFDPTATGGNVIALKLVQEGLRLQPCGPGFVTGRDAILKADTLFYGAQYSCAILRAFARRGVGIGASQGSANVRGDEILSFNGGGPSEVFISNVTAQLENQDIVYTQGVTANCNPLSNYTLTDTLPTHVTYVSGGTYDALNRVVSFNPVDVAAGATQNYQFTVNINPGSYYAPVTLLDDPVLGPGPAIPAAWTASTTNAASFWRVDGANYRTPLYSFFVNNVTTTADVSLRTTNQYLMPTGGASLGNRLSFWHKFETEGGFDGGLVEISTNGGGTWTDLGSKMVQGGYNGTVSGGPVGTRAAFTGSSGGGFIQTIVDLNSYAGQNVMIRFRFISDVGTSVTGWNVDDILLNSMPLVIMKSNLFNASMTPQVSITRTVEIIDVCVPPAITAQPVTDTLCHNQNALYSVTATGSGITYQWELSTDGGGTWNPIAGANFSTYGITNATSALNGRLYRVVITGTCGSVTSDEVGILVATPLSHTGVAATPSTVCQPAPSLIGGTVNGGLVGGGFGNYTHTLTGSGTIVQNPPSGTNNQTGSFTVTNAAVGANSYTFTSFDGYGCSVSSNVVLTTSAPPVITVQPVARIICQGASTTFNVTATGLGLTYQWQLSTDVGTTWNNIPGATGTSVAVSSVALSQSGHQYRVIITTACGSTTSNAVTLDVTPNPIHQNLGATPNPVCQPGPVALTGTAVGGTLAGGTDIVVASSGVINLPLADLATTTNNITVPAFTFNAAANLKVRLNIAHTWVGDLNVRLTTPCGNTIIFDRPGVPAGTVGNSADLSGVYIFDLGAATVIPEILGTTPIPAGSYLPSDVNGASHTWAGLTFPCSAAGTWTISIQDNAAGDVGNLTEWAILGPTAVGQYSHSLTGPGTVVQNPSTGGPSNPTANFTASNLPGGVLTYNLTSTDSRGCSVTSPITVNVSPRPNPIIVSPNPQTVTFNSTGGAISIPSSGNATPYPSTITTTGLPANAQVASVTLNGVTHTFPADIDVLLQSPNGTNVILMSDVGGGNAISNVNYTFADGSPALGTGLNPSGTYSPTNITTPDNFPAPGPGSVTQASPTLASFAPGLVPNGGWNLFVVDDLGGDLGSITSWSITFSYPGVNLCAGSSTQLTILDTTKVLTSSTPITIPSSGNGTPYPGTLAVSGLSQYAKVRSVSLNGLSHTFSADIDILLQSPNGTNVILMSDVGGGNVLNNVNYTFADGFPALGAGANPSGTYSPTNITTPDNFPAPGPGSVTQATPAISLFNTPALTPNGTWNLFVVDDLGGDQGSLTSWSITFDVPGATTITYTWSPATGLSSTTGNPVTASPATSTIYTVNAVSSFGCTSAAPAAVAVNVLALPAITTQPAPATQTICPGYNVSYTVTATGAGLTYQWKKNGVNMVNGGNVSGATSATLTLTAVSAADAATYTVVVSGTCPPAVTSNGAVLQIGTTPTITTQPPATIAVCERQSTTISVVATALPPIQIYQWQVSTNGGTTWTNLANSAAGASPFYNNVFSSTLTIANAPLSINNYQYRVIITTNCGFTITSSATVLTANATPVVTAVPVTARVCLSDTLVVLNGSPTGGVWSGPGVVPGTNQFLPFNTSRGTFTVKYKVTNTPSGCADSALVNIKVEDCPERIRLLRDNGVLLYPNPNNGQFNIRINSILYNYLGMKVFTNAGALVKQQKWTNLPYGRVLPIDLRSLAAGIYMVYVYYEDGVRTSEKTFKVIIPAH